MAPRGGRVQQLLRTGDNPDYLSQLETVIIDPDGVEITGFIFGDNYFELYVNGQFVGRDPIGMTPFNSNVVRFRARYPMTYAVMGVDWETHNGVGMEYDSFNLGDGGLIAYFSDGHGTGGDGAPRPSTSRRSTIRLRANRGAAIRRSARRPCAPACAENDPTPVRRFTSRAFQLDGARVRRRALASCDRVAAREGDGAARVYRIHPVVRRRRVHLDPEHQARQPRPGPLHGDRSATMKGTVTESPRRVPRRAVLETHPCG